MQFSDNLLVIRQNIHIKMILQLSTLSQKSIQFWTNAKDSFSKAAYISLVLKLDSSDQPQFNTKI